MSTSETSRSGSRTPEDLHADVVVGGPPCQGFSALNRDKKGRERNSLWEEFVRIVAKVRPKIFVIENVDRFLKSDEFLDLLSQVEAGGLLSDYRLVDPPGHDPADSEEEKNKRYLLDAAGYGRCRRVGEPLSSACVATSRRSYDGVPGRDTSSAPAPKHRHSRPASRWNRGRTLVLECRGQQVFDESSRGPLRGTELPDGKEHIAEVDAEVPGIFTTRDLHFGRIRSRCPWRAITPFQRAGIARSMEQVVHDGNADGTVATSIHRVLLA